MFTLAIVALLMTGPEWTIQHFDNAEHCLDAGKAIVSAYYEMEPNLPLVAACKETDWL